MKLPLVKEINWDACISNIEGRNNWQHGHNVMVDIFNTCCNNCETLGVLVNVENSNKGEFKKKIFSFTLS
jgi:hypothetical protein